jgi:beta-galactosidase/beta-glucuronidase
MTGPDSAPAGAHGYPRPQLVRREWMPLNGTWDFALDPEGQWRLPSQVQWSGRIVVPFSPETEASGIGNTGFYRACWYRRTIEAPPAPAGERLMLHFGAVDHTATVWIDDLRVARHKGGYTPFAVDITDAIADDGRAVVVVRAEDDPFDLAKPRGKQDWQLEPHGIWYPRTTGIWQTVWMERVPETRIAHLRWTSNLHRWEIGIAAWVAGPRRDGLRLKVRLSAGDQLLSDDTYTVVAGEVHRRIALSDPGIDDFRNELLWIPERPTLIDAEIELWGARGELLDAVRSYTALRTVDTEEGRVTLNNRPYYMRLVLDQGYWPATGLTPPDDAALRRDVELVKALGFNGVRKHQKVEDPRFLYWADRLGLLVWEEMPSAYRFTHHSVLGLVNEWMDIVERDYSHPCVVAWVPLNESWGVPDVSAVAAQRHYVEALYHLTKTLDATRPVAGNDGGEVVATDIIGIHDYDSDPARLVRRHMSEESSPELLKHGMPWGRLTPRAAEGPPQPIMLTEFGGIAYAEDIEKTWGYSRCETVDDLALRYGELLAAVHSLPRLAGFCYTQFTDTYQEANGLLYADRTPKVPIAQLAAATRGQWVPDPTADRTTDQTAERGSV